MSQLSLTLLYPPPTDMLQGLGKGTYRCGSPPESKWFESAVLASPPYLAEASLKPRTAELEWFQE